MCMPNETTLAKIKCPAHCEMGPSSLPARAVCPCYDSAGGSAEADSGTRAHKVVELNIHSASAVDTNQYLPGTTEDEIERGVWGAQQILAIHAETGGDDAPIRTETRVQFASFADPEAIAMTLYGTFGTVDAYWEAADSLHICDFKTYANALGDKDYSPQGMAYAALLLPYDSPKSVTFHTVCAGDHLLAHTTFSVAEAKERTADIIRQVNAIKHSHLFADGGAARAACGHPSAWCKICAHAASCPAINRAVEAVKDGTVLAVPLAVQMEAVPILEAYCKQVKAAVKCIIDDGGRVADAERGIEYVYKDRRGPAKLADLRGLAEALAQQGVSMDDFAAICSVSKTAVDELLKPCVASLKKKDREAIYLPFFAEGKVQRVLTRIKPLVAIGDTVAGGVSNN